MVSDRSLSQNDDIEMDEALCICVVFVFVVTRVVVPSKVVAGACRHFPEYTTTLHNIS